MKKLRHRNNLSFDSVQPSRYASLPQQEFGDIKMCGGWDELGDDRLA